MSHGIFYRVGLYAQAALYTAAGINHFWHAGMYLKIMPDHYSHPAAWVAATGVAEIAGGVGLLPRPTRRLAAIGIVLMLLCYFDVHIFMLQHANDRFANIPRWLLITRIAFQPVLMACALPYCWKDRSGPAENGAPTS